jgi:hypothetical protein
MAYSTQNGTAISVTSLGVRPDGITNNRAALQAAIDSLYPNGPGALFFPKGTYYWSGTVNVTGNDIGFYGENGTVLISAINEAAKKIHVTGAKRVVFDGLTFNGNRSGTSPVGNQHGFISTINTEEVTIENCNLFNTVGAMIYLGGGTKYATITNNYFTGHFCGIYGYINSGERDSERFLITDNIFGDNWVGDVGESASIKLQTMPSDVFTGFSKSHVISNNVINSNCQMGIEVWCRGRDQVISNNNISKSVWGISLDNQENVSVVGNSIKGVDYMGIECASVCKNVTISANSIDGYTGYLSSESRATQYGLSSSNTTCERITYSNNIVDGCEIGVNVQLTRDTILSSNIIRDCGFSLFYQGASRSQVTNNLFETGTKGNGTAYHIFFDASSHNLSGFHLSDNKFRGRTTDQSIFYYTNSGPNTISDICVENNVTDESTRGGYDIFIGGQTTPLNYVYRNNFGPSGADGSNSIQDASDSSSAYGNTNIFEGISYYGSTTWTVPGSGVTGSNGVWLCVWSGGGGIDNDVRIHAGNYSNNTPSATVGSHYFEAYAHTVPYEGPELSDSLLVMPSVLYNDNVFKEIHTQKHGGAVAHCSIWFRVRNLDTGFSGQSLFFASTRENNLSIPFASYSTPSWAGGTKSLQLDSPDIKTLKLSDGVSIGDATRIYSPSSGILTFEANSIVGLSSIQTSAINASVSFTLAGGGYRYLWSGAANCTGTLPAPSTLSGVELRVKNLSATGSFVLSGLIDYSQNYAVTPMQAITLWSNNSSWLIV